ncbi:hypothetical protein BH18VER1_BH18VER1_17170 [soil metagenome]
MASSLRIALALFALVVGSCATTRHSAARQLVGQWRATTQSRTAQYDFAADGTFTGSVTSGGRIIADFSGRWSVTNGAILYIYTDDKKGAIAPGTKDRDELLRVADDHFIIRTADGSERRYLRVTP